MASEFRAPDLDTSSQTETESESEIILTPTTSVSEAEQTQNEDENENMNDDDDEDDETSRIIHYDVFKWLKEQMAELAQFPIPRTTTRALHNIYWRAVFEDLIEKAKVNDEIRNELFEPPHDSVEVQFEAWPVRGGHYCCPCDFDRAFEAPPDLWIKREGETITKDRVLRGICDRLYGTDESEEYFGEESDRPVVERVDYMMHPGGALMGELWVLCKDLQSKEEVPLSDSEDEDEVTSEDVAVKNTEDEDTVFNKVRVVERTDIES